MQNGQGLNFRTFFMHLQISEQWLYSNILPASKNFIVEFFFCPIHHFSYKILLNGLRLRIMQDKAFCILKKVQRRKKLLFSTYTEKEKKYLQSYFQGLKNSIPPKRFTDLQIADM